MRELSADGFFGQECCGNAKERELVAGVRQRERARSSGAND